MIEKLHFFHQRKSNHGGTMATYCCLLKTLQCKHRMHLIAASSIFFKQFYCTALPIEIHTIDSKPPQAALNALFKSAVSVLIG